MTYRSRRSCQWESRRHSRRESRRESRPLSLACGSRGEAASACRTLSAPDHAPEAQRATTVRVPLPPPAPPVQLAASRPEKNRDRVVPTQTQPSVLLPSTRVSAAIQSSGSYSSADGSAGAGSAKAYGCLTSTHSPAQNVGLIGHTLRMEAFPTSPQAEKPGPSRQAPGAYLAS